MATPSAAHRLRALLPLLAGLAAMALALLTRARRHPPDALAYAELAAEGMIWHPQHLLATPLNLAVLALGDLLNPRAADLDHLVFVGALGSGIGLGSLCWLGLRWGLGASLSLAVVVFLGGTQAWWSLATTAEVHALPVGLVLLALVCLVAGGRGRREAGGLLLGLAVLLHKTMLLVLPGVGLGLLLSTRRTGPAVRVLGLAAAVSVGGYGLAWAEQVLVHGAPAEAALEDLVLGEVRTTSAAPVAPDEGRGAALQRGLLASVSTAAGGQCVLPPGELPQDSAQARERGVRSVKALGLLGGGLALFGLVAWARERPLAAGVALGWPLVVLPAVAWFEPWNFEYFLGPLAVALLAAGRGVAWILERRAAPAPVWLVAAGLLALLGLRNAQGTWDRVVGPATEPVAGGERGGHGQCALPRDPAP